MSFDIYFLAADRPWSESLETMEVAAASDERPDLGEADAARWAAIAAAVSPLLPGAETFEGTGFRELSDDATGMQLSLSPGELSLTVPYWHTGSDAEAVVSKLREVVDAVERVSGLVGYDPQADGRFLDGGDETAAGTMDSVAEQMREVLQPPSPRGFFARFFRRR